jgi:hypothetical protein
MEGDAMKQTSKRLMMLGLITSFGLGLVLVGCGQNRAQQGSAGDVPAQVEQSIPAPSAEPDAGSEQRRREAELSRRAREIAGKEEALDRRMRELEQRVETVEQRETELTVREEPIEAEIAEPVIEAVESRAEPRVAWVTLPAATPLEVEITETLSSETSLVGDPVGAVVVRDVIREGRVVVPAGSRVFGTVTEVVAQKKIGGQARLALDFDRLETPSNQQLTIRAFLDEEARSQKKKDAATIGGSAAGGALLGRILSDDNKTRGTLLGAAVGAAVGTVVASNNAADTVLIEAGTVAELRLDTSVDVAVNEIDDSGPLALR